MNNNLRTVTYNYTFGSLEDGIKSRSCPYIVPFSEFIDNSIASYSIDVKNRKFNEYPDVDGLEILISIKNIGNGKQVIEILDNAGGMDEQTLHDGMLINYKKNPAGNSINQHGYGMKFGIFWLGRKVTIITKSKNYQELSTVVDINDNNINDPAIVNINDSSFNFFKNNTGTYIKIEEIRDRKQIGNLKKFLTNDLGKSIGWRYSDLLENGMKIKLMYKDGLQQGQIPVTSFFPDRYNLKNLREKFKIAFDDKKFLDKWSKKLKEKCDEIQKRLELNGMYCEEKTIYDKIFSNEDLWFTAKLEVPDLNGNNVQKKFKWGVLNIKYENSYSQNMGFTLTHMGRAIWNGPNPTNKQDENNSAIEIKNLIPNISSSGGNNTYRRIIGMIDVTGILKPEQNKYDFIWDENKHLSLKDFKEILKNKLVVPAMLFLNELKNMEEDAERVKKNNTYSSSQKVNKALKEIPDAISRSAQNYIPKSEIISISEKENIVFLYGVSFKISLKNFCDDQTLKNRENDFFDARWPINEKNTCYISININSVMIQGLFAGSTYLEQKSNIIGFLWALSINLAILKLLNELNSEDNNEYIKSNYYNNLIKLFQEKGKNSFKNFEELFNLVMVQINKK